MNQLEILKMIESGEITVDQGMELLNKIKDEKIEEHHESCTTDTCETATAEEIKEEIKTDAKIEITLSYTEDSEINQEEQVDEDEDTYREQERDNNNSLEDDEIFTKQPEDMFVKSNDDESITEVDIDGIRNIEIKLISPDRVFVQKSNRDKLMLKIKSDDDGGVIKINTFGDNLQIEEEVMDMKRLFKIFKPCSYQMFIDIPSKYSEVLKVRTVSGDIILDIDNLKKASVSTTSADISGIKLYADIIDIKSVSGDYDVDATKGRVNFNNTSGDMNTYMPHIIGENIFKTVSGDINLTLDEDQGFSVDFKTVSGEITSIFPIETFKSISTRSFKGKFGTPSGDIVLKSVSGDLNITKK